MTTFPLTTTIGRINPDHLCIIYWENKLKAAARITDDTEPVTYAQILDVAGLEETLLACWAEPQYGHLWRLYAVWCARRVQHIVKDQQIIAVLDVAERYANGTATVEELITAKDAASEAAVNTMHDATWAAPDALLQAADLSSPWAATWAANRAADAIWATADHANKDAAHAAERQAQADAFRQLVTTGTLP